MGTVNYSVYTGQLDITEQEHIVSQIGSLFLKK